MSQFFTKNTPNEPPSWTDWDCVDIFVCCSFSGCSVSVTSASRLSSSITHNSAAPAAFHRTNAPHIAHDNISIELKHAILYCYESWLWAISTPSRSLRVPGAAAMVRREEGSTSQKKENVSRTNSPREEEEIMMEPIPRVDEQVAEVVMGYVQIFFTFCNLFRWGKLRRKPALRDQPGMLRRTRRRSLALEGQSMKSEMKLALSLKHWK